MTHLTALTTPKGRVLRLETTLESGSRQYGFADVEFCGIVIHASGVVSATLGVEFCSGTLEECLAFIDTEADKVVSALRAPLAAGEPPVIVCPTRTHIELAASMIRTLGGEAYLRDARMPRYDGEDRRNAVEELARIIAEAEARGEHRGRSVLL